MKIPNWISISVIVLFVLGVYLLFGADWAKTAKGHDVRVWTGGIILGLCVIGGAIGYFSQGRGK